MPSKLLSVCLKSVNKDDGSIDTESLQSLSQDLSKLIAQGTKILVSVGGGPLGEKHVEVARESTKKKQFFEKIRSKASVANSLLVIEALRAIRVRVNAVPLEGAGNLESFMKTHSWSAIVLARPDDQSEKSQALSISRKYRARLLVADSPSSLQTLLSRGSR